MAKKPPLEDPFRKTTPPSEPEPRKSGRGRKRTRDYQPDEVAPIGVGLTFAEGERLAEIAKEMGVENRHYLLLWIVRDFMKRYEEGWRPPSTKKTITVLE
jgi:hypothetical protein